MSEFVNSVDVIRPVVERLDGARDYQVLGGIVSTALRHSELSIDMDHKELRIPNHILSTRRPNHSKRDADILVTTSDPDRIQEIKDIALEEVQKKLTVAVCSIHPYSEFTHRQDVAITHPLGRASFTSDRYEVHPNGTKFAKLLSPFAVPIDRATLEQWQLIINDELSIPVSHPGATLANYTQRSISGIRPKDYDKIKDAATNLFTKEPELLEWLQDGPGRSQMILTQLLYSLRLEAVDAVTVLNEVSLPILSRDELIDNRYFIAPDEPRDERARSVNFAALKARASYGIESRPTLVKMLNNGVIERALGMWTGNN